MIDVINLISGVALRIAHFPGKTLLHTSRLIINQLSKNRCTLLAHPLSTAQVLSHRRPHVKFRFLENCTPPQKKYFAHLGIDNQRTNAKLLHTYCTLIRDWATARDCPYIFCNPDIGLQLCQMICQKSVQFACL